MIITRISIKKAIPTAIVCGILGGLLFIYTKSLPIKGYYSILTYILVLLASTMVVRSQNKMEFNYLNIISFGTLVFVLMTYVNTLYIYFIQYPERDFLTLDNFFRFLVILTVGILSSVLLALIFSIKKTKIKY